MSRTGDICRTILLGVIFSRGCPGSAALRPMSPRQWSQSPIVSAKICHLWQSDASPTQPEISGLCPAVHRSSELQLLGERSDNTK